MSGVIVNLGRILSPEEMAQEIVEEVHRVLDSGLHGQSLFAKSMAHLLKERVWERPRVLRNASIPPMTFDAFLKESYPRGLGTTHDAVRRLIDASPDEADRAEATALWAKLTMKGAGNPTGANQHTKHGESGIVDNVNNSSNGRPTGTSKDAGMRRLIKAAEDRVDPDTGEVTPGDARAKELLDRVLAGDMSVNAAHIEMGWRPKMVSVRAEDAEEIKRIRSASLLDGEVKKDAARMLAARLAERFPPAEWDWLKSTLYTAGAKAIADALASEIGAGVAPMDKAGW